MTNDQYQTLLKQHEQLREVANQLRILKDSQQGRHKPVIMAKLSDIIRELDNSRYKLNNFILYLQDHNIIDMKFSKKRIEP